MAGNRVAVVGIGQTHHRAARKDVSIAGLVREAAVEALDDRSEERRVGKECRL